MNSEKYWLIRKWFKKILFQLKSLLYHVDKKILDTKESNTFRKTIIYYSLWGSFKAVLAVSVLTYIDNKLLDEFHWESLNINIVVSTVLGGIGVAGVILGLYCSNIATIYSSRYINTSEIIATSFQEDKLTNRCISEIINYIIFGLFLIGAVLQYKAIGWAVFSSFLIWSIVVIISYSTAKNRVYMLSDVYNVSKDSYENLENIICKFNKNIFWESDVDFQSSFQNEAEKQIIILKEIQKYASSNLANENTSMVEFMHKNLRVIALYWSNKCVINRESMWFKYKPQYSRWHVVSDIESSSALMKGTSLRTKGEHNYWWFEEELLKVNMNCLNGLFKQHDFVSICLYFKAYEDVILAVTLAGEEEYFARHLEQVRYRYVESIKKVENIKDMRAFAASLEQFSLLVLNMIDVINRQYNWFDFEKKAQEVIKVLDGGRGSEFNNKNCLFKDRNFGEEIRTELKAEGRRITPDWVIKQKIAQEEYIRLNLLIDVINELTNNVFELGELILNHKMDLAACAILTRFYEYENKLGFLINIIERRKIDLIKYKIDDELEWSDFRIDNLKSSLSKWKHNVPDLLFKASTQFAIKNWNNRSEYPDYLGDCFNHICDDAVDAIICDEVNQFEVDFENISKIMLIYQEYIRSDFITNKDLYRPDYAYYMFTSPIVEWAQIGGLAILWGEFNGNRSWKECVEEKSGYIFTEHDGSIAEKMIEFVQNRERFIFGIVSRDTVEANWRHGVFNAIRSSNFYEIQYVEHGKSIRTNSKLIKAFCKNDCELMCTPDVSEIFWVVCVNPRLPIEKRYHTRDGWEKEMYDENTE